MQRTLYSVVAVMLVLGRSSFADETSVVPQPLANPTLTVDQPANPAASAPGGPILTSISARLGPQILNGTTEVIIPDFHFIAPNGNAVLIHRDLVSTDANNPPQLTPSTPINIPADVQKTGAVISGGWKCNAGEYYVTQRAYILAADGSRSNAVQYTIHCNGG